MREFQDLRQTTKTVAGITIIFCEKDLLVPQYVDDEEINKAIDHDMLMSDIRQFMSTSSCRTLDGMVVTSRQKEIDLEMEKNSKQDLVWSSEGSRKRPKVFDSRS